MPWSGTMQADHDSVDSPCLYIGFSYQSHQKIYFPYNFVLIVISNIVWLPSYLMYSRIVPEASDDKVEGIHHGCIWSWCSSLAHWPSHPVGGKKKSLKIVGVEWLGEVHANCPGWDSNLDPQYCGQTHEPLCHGSALHSVGAWKMQLLAKMLLVWCRNM